jgi:hypothetical protein
MRYIIPIFAFFLLCSCSTPPPTQFARTFRRTFDTGDTNALLALVKWDGVPEELRSGMVWKLTNHIGEQRVTKTAWTTFDSQPIIPSNQDGRKLVANLQPKFWLDVTTESLAGISNPPPLALRQFLVGVENEKFYICGFRFQEP